MANPLAPIDKSVKIPDAVKRAAAFADAHYAPAASVPAQEQQVSVISDTSPAAAPPNPDQPLNIVATPAPPPDTAPRPLLGTPQQEVPAQEQLQPLPANVESAPPPDNWEHRYHSMKGRYDQSQQILGGMQEQMAQMGQELDRLTTLQPSQRDAARPVRVLTPQDEQTYGPELVDFAKRAAIEALQPEINAVRQEAHRAAERTQRISEQEVRNELTRAVPNWLALNNDPDFLAWLSLPDIYSRTVRQQLLNRAFAAADAPAVIAFFRGYLAEAQATGQLPAPGTQAPQGPTRTPAQPLVTLVAPGRVQPAPGTSAVTPDKPVFTHAQIAEFYSNKGRARYVGRETDRRADEALIFEAQKDGRIR